MKNVLIVCPIAVGPAWIRQIGLLETGSVTPWQSQIDAARWAAEKPAAMLAKDMGTGKSITALLALDPGPLHPVLLVSGDSKARAKKLRQEAMRRTQRGLCAIVNYDSVWRGEVSKAICEIQWDAIVLDESHRIKSPNGQASKWLAKFAKQQPQAKRLLLTGTPMPHSPLDIYGQFRFLDPEVLGESFVRFRRRYADCDLRFPGKVRRWLNQDELAAKTDPFIWRVKVDDVLDLPDAIHEVLPVPLSSKTARYYRDLERDMTAQLEAGTVTVSNALGRLLRLQQATGGYARVDEAGTVLIDGMPSKAATLEDRLEDLPETEPVVVFCRFRADLNEVGAMARRLGRTYAELSGNENTLERWQEGNATIIGVQIQSGGAGIDLSRAAYCVYYSLGFSLGEYEQSLARLRRPGQTRCVRYYHLVAQGTVDEQVYAALRERRSVVDAVLEKLSQRTGAVA
jgi:SNF2 family DNA or RNA helicase